MFKKLFENISQVSYICVINSKMIVMHLIKMIVFIFTLLFYTNSYAQVSQTKKDSLLHIYLEQSREKKIESLDNIFEYYSRNNLDSAYFFNRLLYDQAIQVNKPKFMAVYYNNAGVLSMRKNDLNKAENFFMKAIDLAKKNNLENDLADYYKNLAGCFRNKNNLNRAIQYMFDALKIYEKTDNKRGIASSYNNLGTLYLNIDNYKKAMSYFTKGLHFVREENITQKIPIFYFNIGDIYKKQKMPDSSMYYYKKALNIFRTKHSNYDVSLIYENIAGLYVKFYNKPDSAFIYYKKIIEISDDDNKKIGIYSKLGELYSYQKNYNKSNKYLYNSLPAFKKDNNWLGLQFVHFYLYQNYKALKKWDSATYHLENFIDYQDSLKIQDAQVEIENLESKYENEKKQLQIEKMQLKQEKEKEIKKLLIAGLLITFISLLFVARNLFLRRKKNRLEKELLNTEKEKIEQDLQHKTRELTSQALMMLQKNKLLEDILQSLASIKNTGNETHKEILNLKRRLKRGMQSDKDWELFRQYFEEINKNFFKKLKEINTTITSSEMKLAALIKLRFSIKESASLLNISVGSVKTARYQLRKKLGLKRKDNLYDYLNDI